MTTATRRLSPETTMAEVLETYPSAKRALFNAYHIGGCHSCAYSPESSLREVCEAKGIMDLDTVIRTIEESQAADDKIQISPAEVKALLDKKVAVKLLDVRSPEEASMASIKGAALVTETLVREIMTSWPKDSTIVLHCHSGMRSMDAASYLIGHGFTNVRSMSGGIDAWSREIDSSIPRY